jgi:hypothetical protein
MADAETQKFDDRVRAYAQSDADAKARMLLSGKKAKPVLSPAPAAAAPAAATPTKAAPAADVVVFNDKVKATVLGDTSKPRTSVGAGKAASPAPAAAAPAAAPASGRSFRFFFGRVCLGVPNSAHSDSVAVLW